MVFVFVSVLSCRQSDSEEKRFPISEIANVQALQSLFEEMKVYYASHPDVDASEVFGNLATKAMDMSRTLDAEKILQHALHTYPKGKARNPNLLTLSGIYSDHLLMPDAGQIICCYLVKSGYEPAISKFQCCLSSTYNVNDSLSQLRNKVYDPEREKTDGRAALQYIAAAQSFALVYPEESICTEHLMEAASIALSVRAYPKALQSYDWIISGHPQSTLHPKAMFLKGFTYDNYLKDIEQARSAYEAFIAKYPNDDFADDAKRLVEMLGLSTEEMLERITSQQPQ